MAANGRPYVVAAALAAALLSAGPVSAGGRRARQAAPVRLTRVDVTADGAYVHIGLHGTATLPAVKPVRTTEGPPRLFIDLAGVLPGDVPVRIDGAGPVSRVRIAPHSIEPPVTRVVFDLTGEVSFGVAPDGMPATDITIAIAAAPQAPAVVRALTPAMVPPPAPGAAAIRTVESARVAAGRSTSGVRPAAVGPQPAPVLPAPSPARTAAVSSGSRATPLVAPASPVPATTPSGPSASAPVAPAAPAPPASATAPSMGVTAPSAKAAAPAGATAPATATPPGASATAPALAAPSSAAQTLPPAPRPVGGFGMGGRVPRPTGRIAVYASGARATTAGGPATSYGDVMTAVSYSFLDRETDGVEYGLDLRHSAYTIEGRDPRVSVYTGFVGARLAGGHASVRAGHLWIDDLGGLGSVAGGQIEARSGDIPASGLGRWRGGVFGGLDPNLYTYGYGEGVRKLGGYAVLEGTRGRRHVAGYVNVHNGDLTERSVLSVANFVPAGPVYIYQVAEYDLSPVAGGRGHDGLTYLFSTARWVVHPRVELQGTASRGRSVDARGLSDDIQAGRPVTQQSIDGLLYESVGGRVTAEVLPRVRAYVGYSRDKNNRDDVPAARWTAGGFASNLLGSGVDLTVSNSRMTRSSGSFHSTFVSAGREIAGRVYATAEFSTALSQVRFVRGDGLVVDTRPSTKRFGGNATVQLWRSMSGYVSLERTLDGDDYREWRALTGITFRLR